MACTASSSTSPAGGADAGGDASYKGYGTIEVEGDGLPDGGGAFSAVVATFETTFASSESCSSTTVSSACRVAQCARVDAGAPPATVPNAGAIDVSSGTLVATVSPGADGRYAQLTGTTLIWPNGTTPVHVAWSQVSDGTVNPPGPFSIDGTAPARIDVSSPLVGVDGGTVPRSTDLALAWTSLDTQAAGAMVEFQLTSGANGAFAGIYCTFDANAGAGTVPGAALTALPAGPGYIQFTSEVDVTQVVDGWELGAYLIRKGTIGGSYPSGAITLE